MQKKILFLFFAFLSLTAKTQTVERPKLVVGIVIDQMRWDYLYRYNRYAQNGGFKRMMGSGFSCENTFISYAPTITACGHASIYTGSVPAINGIAGNAWMDRITNEYVYCVEDKKVKTIGSTTEAGLMSPANLLTTSICDELRLATNFKSKVIGVSLKDRGSILPAGHSANAAYWYDGKTGDWITSSYYMNKLPKWVDDFNAKKLVNKYYEQGWNTLYPINTYEQSTEDAKAYEAKVFGTNTFPYDLKKYVGKNYGQISATPHGNSFTAEFAKAAVINEGLGEDNITDFLAVSFSSTDYIGHSFGPNSIEEEDNFLRLDKELGELFDFLDAKVGKNKYLAFLSADHGVLQAPEFLTEHKIPSSRFDLGIFSKLNQLLKTQFGKDSLVENMYNYQVFLNRPAIEASHLNISEIKKIIIQNMKDLPGIARAFDIEDLMQVPLNSKIRDMLVNGYYPKRGGDIQLILQSQWIEGYSATGTTHGLWNPYDAHIPLLWYGWGIKPGNTSREVFITDIAPTLAALLKIQRPSGSVGNVIGEIIP
jgi:predicted AlkP superfamily pyrophosphatase or phosphodiesterase